jgi:hypothetical protein
MATDASTPAPPDPRGQRIAELEARVAELLQKLAELQAQLAELERAGKRPAAPFARKTHPEHRKRPGRKAGQGKFAWRVPPPPEQVTATKEAPLPACPECGGRLQARKRHEQFVIDLPEAPPPVTR